MNRAKLLYGSTCLGSPGFSSDILWRTRFKAPDSLPLIEIEGRTFLLASTLEYNRAVRTAKVDEVVDFASYKKRTLQKTDKEGIILFLKEHWVTHVSIPTFLPYGIGRELEKYFQIEDLNPPFYPERIKKTQWEIEEIHKSQKATEMAIKKAEEFLRKCSINGNRIYYNNEAVTSEMVKEIINTDLFRKGYLAFDTIVASAAQAADPHEFGTGPLIPYSTIIVDVFPVSVNSHYYGDMTRTFFKGNPPDDVRRMYETVLEAQLRGLDMTKAGTNVRSIWQSTLDFFEQRGFHTSTTKPPIEGFFHSFGHGLGIDIHEPPRAGNIEEVILLEEGNVITAEPGLYYEKLGGVRIEDAVVVKKDGFDNLNTYPKDIDRMIL